MPSSSEIRTNFATDVGIPILYRTGVTFTYTICDVDCTGPTTDLQAGGHPGFPRNRVRTS